MKNMQSSSSDGSRFEVRIAGSGGQGVILAAIVLAEAATLDGKYSAQSQTYGAEARGGMSRADVVLSYVEIDYPWGTEFDILVALTQQGYDQNVSAMKSDGIVIVDSDLVQRTLWRRTVSLPFKQIARELNEERAINMAALGAIAAFCPYVSRDSIATIMTKRLPSAKVEISLRAFDQCMQSAQSAKLHIPDSKEEIEI
jgi:2-oxoglutarate ferredoxin oxidoreductase subunit gamma